ncbi:MAG: hypothetical protein LBS84_01285 [Clostridiales bacterium]|nr:hypothetical protein [Clostridiales bacterium]
MNEALLGFRDRFSRESTFGWFVVAVVGLTLRGDHLGVTSVVRELCMDPGNYENPLHFFRSSAWKLAGLQRAWERFAARSGLVYEAYGKAVLVGDGVQESKEGVENAGCKKAFQRI